jgi:plasmid stability protein
MRAMLPFFVEEDMATLQVRDIDDSLYEGLRRRAKAQHRSLSQEVVHIIEDYLSRPAHDPARQTDMFLQLAGAWQGLEKAEEIVASIRGARVNSARFRGGKNVPH